MDIETMLGVAADFPSQLRLGKQAPAQLYVKGNRSLLSERSIAIVGSREATAEALWFAECLGRAAGRAGLVVVSGGARGIDTAVHGGALAVGGRSIAVLGRPFDAPLPERSRALLLDLVDKKGAVVTERPPGGGFHRVHYIQRNRIIAGLAEVTLVVSAKHRSGALSTAGWASEFGRPLWVVPGAPWETRAAGSNQLLAKGARPIATLHEFETAIAAHFDVSSKGADTPTGRLLTRLARGPCSVDELGRELREPAAALTSALVVHQLEGRVVRTPDGRYALRI